MEGTDPGRLQAPLGPRLMTALLNHCSPGGRMGAWGQLQSTWALSHSFPAGRSGQSWPVQSEGLRWPHLCLHVL